jgi:hypothetical protein
MKEKSIKILWAIINLILLKSNPRRIKGFYKVKNNKKWDMEFKTKVIFKLLANKIIFNQNKQKKEDFLHMSLKFNQNKLRS